MFLIVEANGSIHTLIDAKQDNIKNGGFNTSLSIRFFDELLDWRPRRR
jgi:hypothetical protein